MYPRSIFLYLALLAPCPCLILAGQDVQLLPKPSGPFDVAIHAIELIDTSRLDPFASSPTPRALMVSAIYPLQHGSRSRYVPYMPIITARFEDEHYSFPNGTYESLFLQVGYHSKPQDAPIVIFSPAQGNSRLDYSHLVSNVASYGFTVIMIDSPYDADIVEFPDGSIILAAPVDLSSVAIITAEAIAAVNVRAQDTTFVLNQLSNATVVDHLIPGRDCALDTNSIAMFGHSLGGAATAAAMVNETRIKGGVTLDGAIFGDVLSEGLDQPFLIVGHTNNTRLYVGDDPNAQEFATTWSTLWSVLRGWKLELELAGSLHYTFSDFPVQIQQSGVDVNATEYYGLLSGGDELDEADAEAAVGSLMQPERGLEVVVDYVVAFLDFVLKGKDEVILKGPNPRFPEVTFV